MPRNLLAKFRPSSRFPSPTGCEKFEARLFAYLDGDTVPGERNAIERHLETCAACRQHMAACRRSEAMLGSLAGTIPSPGDLRPEFYARLEQSRRRSVTPMWARAAPALACALLAGLFVGGRSLVGFGSTDGRPTASTLQAAPQSNRPIDALAEPHKGDAAVNTPTELHAVLNDALIVPGAAKSPGKQHGRRFIADHRARRRTVRYRGSELAVPVSISVHVAALTTPQTGKWSAAAPMSLASVDKFEAESAAVLSPRFRQEHAIDSRTAAPLDRERHTTLASLETELHVSDEDRDFMSSTRIGATGSHKNRAGSLSVDGDNDNTQEPVELPALP